MKILFLCTGNSCRSQMAEGFARHLGGERVEAFSAGTEPADQVHPLAIRVMAEKGIDLSTHRPKKVEEFLSRPLDAVITVCGDAQERCPVFPGPVQREHWPLPDPAKATGSEEEVLEVFRTVRDEIQARVTQWLRERT
jgi:arsenate reductase